eukprot:213452-Chlamydomonas_euryale.AAC.9
MCALTQYPQPWPLPWPPPPAGHSLLLVEHEADAHVHLMHEAREGLRRQVARLRLDVLEQVALAVFASVERAAAAQILQVTA